MNILTEYEAEEFLSKEGFPVVNRTLCITEKEAYQEASKKNFNVVLKIASKEALHKTELHGVRMGITKDTFSQHYKELSNLKLKKEGILVQDYVEGLQLILGLKKDPVFGHVLLVGLGGIYAEVFKDTALKILPVEKKDIHALLQELKSYQLLKGYRGSNFNLTYLEKILLKFNHLIKKHPSIQELDINPFILNEKEGKIADARIVFN